MLDEEKMKELEERDKKLEDESNRFIVMLKPKFKLDLHGAAEASGLMNFGEIKHTHNFINALTIEGGPDKGSQLASFKGAEVQEIIKDRRIRIMLDVSVPLIEVPKVWKEGKNKGKGVVVAVVDTGVDNNHPDLKGRVIKSKDFTEEGDYDGFGHGTHVAGTIAGNGKAAKGKYTGVAPEANIIAAKVLDSWGSGWMSDVIAGIEWAVNQGADVINLSLGSSGPCDGTDATSQACDAAVDAGVTVCVAAGNSGPDSGTVGSPACARKVITVGASDDDDKIAWFSSRGPTKDNRVKPDVCFPGVGIVAARADNTSMGSPVGNYYTTASGTSMATPHAAGVAALLIAEAKKRNVMSQPSQVKDLILKHAHDLGYDNNTDGHGRGDAYDSWKEIEEGGGGEPGIGIGLTPLQMIIILGGIGLIAIIAIIIISAIYIFL